MNNELTTMAQAITYRREIGKPVEDEEMAKILEHLILLGMRVGVESGMKFHTKETKKRLTKVIRETEQDLETFKLL